MLIRFAISNFFSFDETKELNMIPNPKYRRLGHHKYAIQGFEILKMTALYGANGAGKSNLIKALSLLKEIVLKESLPPRLKDYCFKFQDLSKPQPQILAIEFFQADIAYLYALEIVQNRVQTEELYESGLGKSPDKLIFERKTDEKGKISLTFLDAFEKDAEGKLLKNVIAKNLAKPNKSLLKLLVSLNNPFLEAVRPAFQWFEDSLEIIHPDSKPHALANRMDLDADFRAYAQEMMSSFHIGITSLISYKQKLKDLIGEGQQAVLEKITEILQQSPNAVVEIKTTKDAVGDFVLVQEAEDIYVKQVKLEHTGKDNISALFNLEEQSDGTIRLLEFVPAFKDLGSRKKVVIIDEMERSMHPLLIKELITKFSLDEKSEGQLIFTTHESQLLDQEILRQDEIWFAEKKQTGSTDLYALSDFKEHNTIDIRKGYLNGRYGSIPFLANLQDLNWHKYDSKK
jgi:uncharacterized protein